MSCIKYQFVTITGPSCVGKSPLRRAFYKHQPDLAQQFALLTLYTSRPPRPGEQDGDQYHFRSRDQIQELGQSRRYLIEKVRDDLQAVEPDQIVDLLTEKDHVLYEGNPFIAKRLKGFATEKRLSNISIFLSPLSRIEIEVYLRDHSLPELEQALTDYMKEKLTIRARKFASDLEAAALQDIHRRASSTLDELRMASEFDVVLPNHDNEGSPNWEAFDFPIGDAAEVLSTFIQIIRGEESVRAENWSASMFSPEV